MAERKITITEGEFINKTVDALGIMTGLNPERILIFDDLAKYGAILASLLFEEGRDGESKSN